MLRSRDPVTQRTRYQVRSNSIGRYQSETLSQVENSIYTRLPEEGNSRTYALAEELKAQNLSPSAAVREIAGLFNTQFVYTLSPPRYGEDTIDEFLFDGQRGFCEHYASAAVFLLRAMGIPSRIIVGYQGGEVNPSQEYIVVRQLDAHAWVEYWQQGVGWRRFDPTAAVAPERIEGGIEQIAQSEEVPLTESAFSLLNYQQNAFFNWVRWRLDSFNYYWSRWILSYDRDHQMAIWQWLTRLPSMEILSAILIGVPVAIALVIWSLTYARARRVSHGQQLLRALRQFRNRLRSAGLDISNSDSPTAMIDKAITHCDESQHSALKELRELVVSALYAQDGSIIVLYRKLNRFRFSRPSVSS